MTDWTPTRKITAVAIGGAISVLLTWVLQDLLLIPVPTHVGQAISLLSALAAGYCTKESV